MARILAIDDDAYFLLSLNNFLTFKQHRVMTVQNPFLVQEILQTHKFDCVLMDIQMPGLNGFELINTIREREPHLPIIVISGLHTWHHHKELAAYEAIEFIEKPFNPLHLLKLIEKFTKDTPPEKS